MEEYYKNIQQKVLLSRDIINSLVKNQRIIGDYYEAIVRDIVRENISEAFSVGRGVIVSRDGATSRECDIIVFNAVEYGPLFKSGDILVVTPEAVRCVIEVKGTLGRRTISYAATNLSSVDNLRKGIWKFLIGFQTREKYENIVKWCVQTRAVNGVFVFDSTSRNETKDISLQMKNFVGLLKEITLPAAHQIFDAGDILALSVTGPAEFEVAHFPT